MTQSEGLAVPEGDEREDGGEQVGRASGGDTQVPHGSGAAPSDLRGLARWTGGLTLASLRYFVTRVPLYRRGRPAGQERELPDPRRELPGDPRTLQRVSDGVGPLFHRQYWIDVTDTETTPEGLIDAVARHLDDIAPTEVSTFERAAEGDLAIGEELVVTLVGPWDGPVRVIDRAPTSFSFATLRGHMEAGEITFRAFHTERGFLRFEIDSWARAGDERFDYVYDHLPLAREAQLHMWSHFCHRVAKLSGGIVMSNVAVSTERYDWDADEGRMRSPHVTAPISSRALRRLPELSQRGLNFDADRPEERTPGWRIDDYCQPLPREDPGDPVDGGPWMIARHILERYAFADPDIVRAAFYPDEPLEGRNMILEGRFYGLRFLLGLRVGGVLDDDTTVGGRPVRRWGWNYRTLEDHLEVGQMDYAIWKWKDTGEVEFRVHVFSRAAHIPNPVVRLGFGLFGRGMQQRFARRALARMREMVEVELSRSRRMVRPD